VGVVAVEATDEAVFCWVDDTATCRITLGFFRVGFVSMQGEIITPAVTAVVVAGAEALTELVPALGDVAGEKEPDGGGGGGGLAFVDLE